MRSVVAIVLLVACKAHVTPAALDEKCEHDRDCVEPLVCWPGLRATQVCIKTCGPTALDASLDGGLSADTTCPAGWECSATLVHRLVDKTTRADKGSAWAGWADQPICVPTGWKPSAR